MEKIILAEVPIADMKYCVPEGFKSKFLLGDIVDLITEPTNDDPKAVEVYWRDAKSAVLHKVGYVGRPLNQAIFALLSAGYPILAHVTTHKSDSITIILGDEETSDAASLDGEIPF